MCRDKSVDSVRSVVLHVLHAGIFLLDANMKLVLLFHSLVTIQSIWVLTQSALLQVTSLLILLDLSLFGYPSLTVEIVPVDNNSMS
jgi:hypothetical protein